MSKASLKQFNSDLKLQISRIILPPIITAEFSDLSPVTANPLSFSNSTISPENKKITRKSTLESQAEGEQKAIDHELKKYQRVSLKLGQILENTHTQLQSNKAHWKSLSPKAKDEPKKQLLPDLIRSSINSPTGSKAFLNKHRLRSKVFDDTIKWIGPIESLKKPSLH